jgi:hypothetical protein
MPLLPMEFAGSLSTPSAAERSSTTAPSANLVSCSLETVHSCETQTTAPHSDAVLCPSFGGSPTPCLGSVRPHDSNPWRGDSCSRNLVSCSLETVHSCETQTTAPRGDAVLCPSFGGSPTPCFGSAQPHDSDPWRGECYCSRNVARCFYPGTSGRGFKVKPSSPGVVVPTSFETVSLETAGPHNPIPPSACHHLETLLSEILPLQSSDEQSLHLADIFPTLVNMSFAQIVDKSKIYLKAAALSRASADALDRFALDPASITVDLNIVAEHSLIAGHQGLPSLLRQLSDNLKTNTLQPLDSTDAAIVEAAMPGATALWASLVSGSDVSCLDSFTPSDKYLSGPVPPHGVQLAFQRLVRGDQLLGRCTILPLELVQRLNASDPPTTPFGSVPCNIALKADTPKGRLSVDPSREGPNAPEKKPILVDKWGQVTYPTIADYC